MRIRFAAPSRITRKCVLTSANLNLIKPESCYSAATEMACWYTVCCKPRQETIAQENLQRQNYHVYLPRLQTRKRRSGKWVEVVEALFPGYLFIRLDPQMQSTAPVRSTRGTVGLLRFGGQPARVPEEIIAAIRQHEDTATGIHRDNCPPFKQGEAIKLVEGPLTGMEGIFSQQDGKERAIILLELLGKANRVAVQRDWIAKAA